MSVLRNARKRLSMHLYKMLPARMKRLVFWGSIVGEIHGKDSKEVFKKVNKEMLLSSDDAAVALPAYLHQIIWCNEGLRNALKRFVREKTKSSIEALLNILPSWLMYSDKSTIESDMNKYVSLSENIA